MAAISATFIADFTSFLRGTDIAVDRLQDLDKQAAKTDKTLAGIGGDMPPNMQKAAKSTEQVEKNIGLMGKAADLANSQFGKMFGAFTAANLVDKAVTAIVDFGAAALETAGHVSDLSDSTGLSTTAIQQMSYVAAQTGSDLDVFAKSAQKLGINISAGSKETKQAIDDIGLSYDNLRKQKPEDQFNAVMEALGKVTDVSDRNRLGVQLLGKSFTDMGAAAVSGYSTMAKEATVASEEQIKALDAAGDAWAKMKSQLMTAVTSGLGSAWIEFEKFANGFNNAADNIAAKLYKVTHGVLGMPKNLVSLKAPGTPEAPPAPTPQPPHHDAEAEAKAEKAKADALREANAERQRMVQLTEQMSGMDIVKTTEKEIAVTKALGGATHLTGDAFEKLLKDLDASAEALDRNNKSAQATAMRDFRSSLLLTSSGMETLTGKLTVGNMALQNQATAFNVARTMASGFDAQVDIATLSVDQLQKMLGKVDEEFNKIHPPTREITGFAEGIKKGIGQLKEDLTGGKGLGGFMENIGGQITGQLSNILQGGISSAISAGIGLLTKGVGKLFGVLTQSESRKTNDTRDALIKSTYGTEDALRQLAFQAGATEQQVRAIFSTRTVESFQKALGVVQSQIDQFHADQEADQARLQSAIEKYKFSIEELGPALQKQKLDEQSKDLIEDWRVLIEAGVDIGTVNEKMADSVNDYLKIAKKTGTEVPAAMKPILQSMIDQGKLTDEAGNQIKDLQSAGVTFSETLTQGFDRVVAKLDQMLKKLGGVNDEIADIPDSIDVKVNVSASGDGVVDVGQIGSNQSGIPGGDKFRLFNEGTHGRFLDFGQGTPAILHGKERVVTEDEIGTTTGGVQAMVDAVYTLNTTLLRAMRENSLMTRDQIQLARA